MIDNADDGEVFFGPKSSSLGKQTQQSQTTRLFNRIPKSPNGFVLITTRDKRVGELLCDRQPAIVVHPLDSLKAEAMLQSKVAKDKWSVNHAHNLLSELDNLPLAITQAAAFISDNNITIKEYLDILHENKLGVADLLFEDLQDPRRDLDAPSSVMQTWKISFDQIRKQEPRAADVLSLMAVLDRQGIPKMVLSQEGDRTINLTSALGTLQAFSLITAERGGASFEVHRLVQLSTRRWLEFQGDIAEWQQEALVRLSSIFPDGEDYEDWVTCEVLSPHTQIVLQYESLWKSHLLSRAMLLRNVASYNMEQGR